jgi:hypothetical protein
MKLSTNTILIIFGFMALGIFALIPIGVFAMPLIASGRPQPVDAQATVQAVVNQTMVALTQNAPTQTPLPPTNIPSTNTPVPTSTPVPTATQVTYCEWAYFIKDVTVADGTVFAPGETFTKTWRLKNRGTCTWTADYMLVYTSGAQMGGTTALRLPGNVAPGQTVDISVTLTAPSSTGPYTGYWMLRNSSGTLFGSGDKANVPFYVDIVVRDQPLPHGNIAGSLCYPSEFNPPMTLYVENVNNGERYQFAMSEAQNYYNVLVPNGSYYVYAWAPGYNLEGAYADPNTNLMLPVKVYGGQTTNMINLCNWSPNLHGRGQ